MKKLLTLIASIACVFLLPSLAWAADNNSLNALYLPSPADQSVIYLGYVFGVVNGVLHGTGSQIMGKMFSQYNSAVLALAGLVVIYTTLLGVLNTAHEGEFLGKKYSSFFIPFRTVLGILLITPTDTGYSWIQVIAMWVVLQGVTAANMVWHSAVDYVLNGGGVLVVQNQNINSSDSLAVRKEIAKLVPATICLHALQNIQMSIAADTSPTKPPVPTQTPMATVMSALDGAPTDGSHFAVAMPWYSSVTDPVWNKFNGICGNINGVDPTAIIATKQAILDVYQGTSSVAGPCDVGYYIRNPYTALWTKLPTTPPGFYVTSTCASPDQCQPNGIISTSGGPAYNAYNIQGVPDGRTPVLSWCNPINTSAASNLDQTVITAALDYLGLTYKNTHQNQGSLDTLKKAATDDPTYSSWFNAGTYYFALLQASVNAQSGTSGAGINITFPANSTVNSAAASILKAFSSDSSDTLVISKDKLTQYLTPMPNFLPYLNNFLAWTLPFFSDSSNSQLVTNFINIQKTVTDYNHLDKDAHGDPKGSGDTNYTDGQGTVPDGGSQGGLNIMFQGMTQMYDSYHQMQVAQASNAAPMVLMMNFGAGMVKTAVDTWVLLILLYSGLAFGLAAFPCFGFASAVNAVVNAISPVFTAILVPLFVTGGMLLYYLPAVPFMIFTFGTIGWMIGVIEAMIAAPIVGFAIMNPEGNDIFGKGDQGVMLMLNLFLRPPLMIFGLIAGIMISSIGLWIINAGFDVSVTTYIIQINGGWRGGWETMLIGMIAIPMIYLIMVMQVINRSFTLIYILPDKVTRWMSGGQQESLGSEMSGMEKEAKGGMSEGMGTTGKAASGASSGITGAIGKKWEEKNKEKKDSPENGPPNSGEIS